MTNQLAYIVRCFVDLVFLQVLYIAGERIGVHLIETFIALIILKITTYSMPIPIFKQLFEDLNNTDTVALLNAKNPAFRVIYKEQFFAARYDENVCHTLKSSITDVLDDVTNAIRKMLPRLANGFQNKKGKVLGFRDENNDSSLQSETDSINPERSVGFISYELGRRCATQLPCDSTTQVKSRSPDLLEFLPSGSFSEHCKVV